jgi:hypothetical protein
MITALIIGCEIGFWVFVAAGLAMRYVARKKRAGAILLLCTPVVDLILLAATAMDLQSGASATIMHGIAAVYIGASVAFGHRMIRWADVRFAHWFANGPAPEKLYGKQHARHERQGWLLHLIGWGIGCAILYGMITWIGDDSDTEKLEQVIRTWSLVLGIDFLISFSYTLFPRKAKSASF